MQVGVGGVQATVEAFSQDFPLGGAVVLQKKQIEANELVDLNKLVN